MAYTQQQIRFEHWANEQSLAAVVRAGDAVPEALSALAHSVAMSQLWLQEFERLSNVIFHGLRWMPSNKIDLILLRDR